MHAHPHTQGADQLENLEKNSQITSQLFACSNNLHTPLPSTNKFGDLNTANLDLLGGSMP
jgi:hypothetical protein